MTNPTGTDLYQLGYRDLISVVPPRGVLSPLSNIKPEMRGKSPGRLNSHGEWGGYDWRKAPQPTIADVMAWEQMGANIGLRADHFPSVDIDCDDELLANIIECEAMRCLGPAPKRIGRDPKRLLVYRTAQPFGRVRLWIGNSLVEVLGAGQQFVVAGTHPVTMQPYTWPWGTLNTDDLIEITRDDVEAFLQALEAGLDAMGYACRREGSGSMASDRGEIDQDALRGDALRVQAALACMPNDNDHFAGRDDYLRVGYAIKAALGEDGFPLFADWASRWEGNDRFAGNDPETVNADWDRMKPPFEVGANWLYETASRFGYDWAGDEFDAIDPPPDGDGGGAPGTPGAPAGSPKGDGPIEFSQGAVANVLLRRYGKIIKYCEEKGWLLWDEKKWNAAANNRIKYLARKVSIDESHRALSSITPSDKANAKATQLCNVDFWNGVANAAMLEPSIQITINDLDKDEWLLNTPGGVVDLRTGELMPHDPRYHMTRMTTVSPEPGGAPIWRAFLHQATGGDIAMQRYLQRLAGYALTGNKREHNLAFFYGSGRNGKGTFLGALRDIWGDYHKSAPMNAFMANKFDQHPTELAVLAGARLVTAQETKADKKWDDQRIKMLTSTDAVPARFMHKDFFEFIPTFKLIFAGNNEPGIDNVDEAMRSRLHIVPFKFKPEDPDFDLPKKIEAEYPQILQWAIEGAIAWQKEGLNPPGAIVAATQEYFANEDEIGSWMAEHVENAADLPFIGTSDLYECWREYCGANGLAPGTVKAFVRRLLGRGFQRSRSPKDGARGFRGVKLINRINEFPTL